MQDLLIGLLGRILGYVLGFLESFMIPVLKQAPIPSHVAFIMDGNRRFAKKLGLPAPIHGHQHGFQKLLDVLEWSYKLGIRTITVYAFSLENFKRSPAEVEHLMGLAVEKFRFLMEQSELVEKYKLRFKLIGELDCLPEEVRRTAEDCMEATKNNQGPTILTAFPYTARMELVGAANAVLDGKSIPTDRETFQKLLYTAGTDPVDILVRTSGERRLSDFLNWQICDKAVQIEFLDNLWPDLTFWHFIPILCRYQLRKLYNYSCY